MANELDIFEDKVSELTLNKRKNKGNKKGDRDLKKELFGKKDVNAEIDAYESMLGYPAKKPSEEKVQYKNKIFTPNRDGDSELLNELMNSKDKYRILMWKDTWTAMGDYKVFVIYTENLESEETHELGEEHE